MCVSFYWLYTKVKLPFHRVGECQILGDNAQLPVWLSQFIFISAVYEIKDPLVIHSLRHFLLSLNFYKSEEYNVLYLFIWICIFFIITDVECFFLFFLAFYVFSSVKFLFMSPAYFSAFFYSLIYKSSLYSSC